jgi:hypothetical protein
MPSDPDSPTDAEGASAEDADPEEAAAEDTGTDDPDAEFAESLERARELLAEEDVSAFYVGTVRQGQDLSAASAYLADDPEGEGMQALSLLASHVHMVAQEAGVDIETAARDAAKLAERTTQQ